MVVQFPASAPDKFSRTCDFVLDELTILASQQCSFPHHYVISLRLLSFLGAQKKVISHHQYFFDSPQYLLTEINSSPGSKIPSAGLPEITL